MPNWSALCLSARQQPSEDRVREIYGTGFLIICLSVVCALVSGLYLRRYLALSVADRQNAWRLYGVFASLCVVTCILAACSTLCTLLFQTIPLKSAFVTNPNILQSLQTIDVSDVNQLQVLASAFSFQVAYLVLYPVELALYIVAALLVLDLLVEKTFTELSDSSQAVLQRSKLVVLAVIVAGSVVGLVYMYMAAARVASISSALTAQANRIKAGEASDSDLSAAIISLFDLQSSSLSSQKICESFILAFALLLSLVTALLCCLRLQNQRRIIQLRRASNVSSTSSAPASPTRPILVLFFVITTLSLRAIFVIPIAAESQEPSTRSCDPDPCAPCHTQLQCLVAFYSTSPVVEFSVRLITQPVTLLFALWGLTSSRVRLHIARRTQQDQLMMRRSTTTTDRVSLSAGSSISGASSADASQHMLIPADNSHM